MITNKRRKAEEFFQVAVERSAPDRIVFLAASCEGDTALHDEVDELLAAHDCGMGEFLSPPTLRRAPDDRSAAMSNVVLSDDDMSVPKQIGPYEVRGELGRGGMGVVYLGRDSRLDRDVAIKALPPDLGADPGQMARLEREAKVLASLNHPNIAAIYSLEVLEGRHYLVLEYVAGVTLQQRLRNDPMTIDEALETAVQIAMGIEAAHEHGVIHRDLKPANVKIRPDGQVKLLDFGIAKTTRPPEPISDSDTTLTLMTQPGSIVGTPSYMSPEQARGQEVDKRTDLWSFGCLLFECLTGRIAFPGASNHDAIAAVLTRDPDWSQLPAGLPPRVGELLHQCLEKDRAHRLRDIGDARLQLEAACHECRDARGRWRRRRVRMPRTLLAAGVVLAIGCLGVIALLRHDPVPDATAMPAVPADVHMEIKHYRGRPPVLLGKIGLPSVSGLEQDDVLVDIQLARPLYLYLIQMAPDGQIGLCPPADDVAPTVPVSHMRYPTGEYTFGLEEGTGLQAFVVVASSKPLPAYDSWLTQAGPVPWGHDTGDIPWRYDGASFVAMTADRGPRLVASPPETFVAVIRHLEKAPGVQVVHAIVFPVLAAGGETPSGPQ